MSNSTDIGTPQQSPVSTIQRTLQVLQRFTKVFEVRVLGIPRGRSKPATAAGWFDNIQAACKAVQTYVMQKAAGIYITLNPVDPALLARTDNLIREHCAQTTADKDIVRRVWLFFDFDPERADGISSSQGELDGALVIANRCRVLLRDQYGWPDPLEAMSGNGIHHVYRIDLPNNEAAKLLVQRVLQGIAGIVHGWQEGNPIQIKVDPVVFNAARIIKLWGTPARKGANTADRPHRTSDILSVPDQIEIVSVEKLQQVAALAPTATPNTPAVTQSSGPVSADRQQVLDRARKYVAKLPPAIGGQGGDRSTFRTACVLVKDFALSVEDALPIFQEWNQTCQPPWTDKELIHKLESAAKQTGPVGKLLENDRSPRADRRANRRQPGIELEGIEQATGPAKKVEVPPPVFLPFPIHCLPEPIRTYVIETAESMLCDPCFIVLPLLAAVGSAIGNARRIRLKNHWTEPCVFWTVIVGESGTMKSPALDAALTFLRKLQTKAFADFQQAMEEYNREMVNYQADVDAWKKGRRDGTSEPPPEPPLKPVCVRYICADTTVEALADILEGQPRGMLMTRDEFSGWLNSFDAYKSCKGSDVAHWLSMHRAGEMTVDRKTGKRITYIPHAAVSMTGGIQPTTMATALAGRYRPNKDDLDAQVEEAREHFDNGLAARLLFAMPPRKAKVWTDKDVSPEIYEKLQRLFDDLVSLEMGTDENGTPCPVDLKFTPKALKLWIRFYNEHAQEQVQLAGDVAAAWSKLEGYAARFALLFHLIRYAACDPKLKSSDEIDEQSLADAIEVSRWFGDETSRIYAEIGARTESPQQRERRLLIRTIKDVSGGITPRELMRHCNRYRGKVTLAEAALQSLVDDELGIWRDRPTTGKGGRPTQEFVLLNPADIVEAPLQTAGDDPGVDDDHDGIPAGDYEVPSPSPPVDDVPQCGIQSDDPDLDLNGLDLS